MFNQALLGKWLNESEAWWKAIVDAKFDCDWGGWCSSPSGSHGVWGFGSTLEGGGGFFQVVPDFIRVIALRSDFGMMYGVARYVSRKHFQCYI